jgi:hypothetical protein
MTDDDDIIKPISDRDEGTPEERSREHYREFKARETAICEDKGLTDAHSRVLWRVLLHFNHKTGQCDPSLRGLADRLGYSKTTIIDALKAGQARGHLAWPTNPGGTKRRNQYVVLKPNDQDTQTVQPGVPLKRSTPADRSDPSADTERSSWASGTVQRHETERSAATQPNGPAGRTRTTEEELLKLNYEKNRPALLRNAGSHAQSESQISGSEQASKRTSKVSKPSNGPYIPAPIVIERIVNGCAWLPYPTEDARCFAIDQYADIVARCQKMRPDVPIAKVKIYVPRDRKNSETEKLSGG